jgi:hypothetical protein
MNKRVLWVLLSVSVWAGLLGSAQAQYVVKTMKVDVPFEFQVRGNAYPAGTYSLQREGSFLFLRNHNGQVLNILNTVTLRNEKPATTSKLVFFHYNGLHLLTQVLWEGDKTGAELLRKGREEEVVRRIAPVKVESAAVGSQP